MVFIPLEKKSIPRRPLKHEETPDLELMTKGSDEIGDKEYFELLQQNSYYLFARFSREKIAKWRKDLRSIDDNTYSRAQDNLKKIGESLGKIGCRKPDDRWRIVLLWDSIVKEIKQNGVDKAPIEEKRAYLKKHFKTEVHDRRLTAGQMADAVLSHEFNCTSDTIKTYRNNRGKIIREHQSRYAEIEKNREEIFLKNERFREANPEKYEALLIMMGAIFPGE